MQIALFIDKINFLCQARFKDTLFWENLKKEEDMKVRVVLGGITLMVMALLLGLNSDSFGWGGKAKKESPPTAEIVSAVQKALIPRLFSSESDAEDGPDSEETRFVIMYAFSPMAEKCPLCNKDLQEMFEVLLFNSEQVRQGKISVWMMTEVDSKTASEYLTNILASLFNAKKIEPAKVESYFKAIHFLAECESDFSEVEGAQLPVIGIVDTTKEDEENEGNIYISMGAPGPWSKFDQLILSKSSP